MKSAAAVLLAASFATCALAQDFTNGTINKVDLKVKKVTLMHEAFKNLVMPAKTMVFQVADEGMLKKFKQG